MRRLARELPGSRGSDLIASLFLPSDAEYGVVDGMPRRLRLQYPDAIYHLMARGNGRQDIVCDDVDRERLQEHLGRAAIRCSWRIYAFAIMPNTLHVVLKTPQPNLSRGSGKDTHYAADPNRSGNNSMSTRGRVGDAVAGVNFMAKKKPRVHAPARAGQSDSVRSRRADVVGAGRSLGVQPETIGE